MSSIDTAFGSLIDMSRSSFCEITSSTEEEQAVEAGDTLVIYGRENMGVWVVWFDQEKGAMLRRSLKDWTSSDSFIRLTTL